jgi:hypothetical protein
MKLQKTETTNRLKTLSQTKKAPGAHSATSPLRSQAKSPRMLTMKNPYTMGRSVRRGYRAARAPKIGTTATIATNVAVKTQGRRSTPPATPISSLTGRRT